MSAAHTVDDMDCRTLTDACPHNTSMQRQSHSMTKLDCVGPCSSTSRLSSSVPLVPDSCERTRHVDVATTAGSGSDVDAALETDCDLNSVMRLHQSQCLP